MRIPVIVSTVAVVLAAATISAAPAGAAAAPVPQAAPVTTAPVGAVAYHERVTAHRQAGASAAAPATIWCELWVTFPTIVSIGQKWGPYTPTLSESVGGASWVQCNAVMTQISVVALLEWAGMQEPPGIPVQRSGTNFAISYNISVCSSGDWAVGGDAMVVWPPGYGPPSPMAGFGPSLYLSPMDCA